MMNLVSQFEGEVAGAQLRLPYVAPRLLELGDLRDLTLGASPGVGDSGNR